MSFSNNGNYINNNFGDSNQYFYQGPPPRRPSSFWVDRWCRALTVVLVVAIVACASHWMYAQWQPFLAGSIPAGGVKAHFGATFPFFWTVTTLAVCYGYCNLKLFSSPWGPDSRDGNNPPR
ncbi:hypothetical protein [Hymenobacter sp.]|uniref:hypothetical protein n=1 Tax=Hymenobacter sp. TaxID=1898978 RepID=UPI00286CE2F6|nr:hypothetical protein [Hymenobacter sp.]